jgi:hypothetical protein
MNRLKEDYQISLGFRFNVEMLNFNSSDNEQRFNVHLGLLAQLYLSCKIGELRQNRNLLGKTRKGSTAWSLSTYVTI